MNNQNAIVLSGEDFIEKDGQYWMTATELGRRLGFTNGSKGVRKLYQRHQEELKPFATGVTLGAGRDSLGVGSGVKREHLMFTEVGCYIITMLARTSKAKAFRRALADFLQKYRSGEVSVVTQKLAESLLHYKKMAAWHNQKEHEYFIENMIRRKKSLSFTKAECIYRASFDEGLSNEVIGRVLGIPWFDVFLLVNHEGTCRKLKKDVDRISGLSAQQLLAEVSS